MEVAPLEVLRPRAPLSSAATASRAGVTVLGMGELEQVRAAEFVGGVPEHPADGVVGALDRAVPTGDHAADRRLLEGDPVQLRLPAQRLSSLPLLSGTFHASGDVADGTDRERMLADLHLADPDLHRKTRAVLATADRLDRLRGGVICPRQARVEARELGEVVAMAGCDDVLQGLSDYLLLLVAE